jgi:hypothetical protein
MTDTEILDELVALAAEPMDLNEYGGTENEQFAAEVADGFWRGLIRALAQRRTVAVAL